MDSNTNIIVAKKKTYWDLVNNSIISVPNYQREYAQGRINRRAELIRKGFVNSLYDSIKHNEPLELDFIFGGKESDNADDSFIPVDGQQRLTILFLLHWYVFMRANRYDYLSVLGEHFKYQTRTTSETFCMKICAESWSFNYALDKKGNSRIASQIKDKPWFTGAMKSDPTVKSMLVVLDCIHERLLDTLDYVNTATLLTSNECPISFYCLDLNNTLGKITGIRDLYIKMNSRGVSLTDFELFKADMQKKNNKSSSFDLLADYLKENDSSLERVKIIGRFNNEYTNFFFNLVDDGKIVNSIETTDKAQMFDISMMNFINEVFRMNYFCTISELGVSQKAYRTDNDVFRKMSGKEFTSFIETSGKEFNDKYWKKESVSPDALNMIRSSNSTSFRIIIDLLDAFTNKGINFDSEDSICRESFRDLIKKYAVDPQAKSVLAYRESLIRMALFSFILRFGVPETEEQCKVYLTWSRFVWKMDQNSDFKNFDEGIDTLRGYKTILDSCENCTYIDIINAIAHTDVEACSASAKLQLAEEIIKANLIASDCKWEEMLKTAEDYYSNCSHRGQLWFLLELSKNSSDNYDYYRFIKAFDVTKMIFDEAIHIEKVDSGKFERALLAVKEFESVDHLLSMGKYTTNTKKFVGKDFSSLVSHQFCESSETKEQHRYLITLALLREMVNESEILDMDQWLENYIKDGSSSVDWKDIFIKNDLLNKEIDGFVFKNGFEPEAWIDDGFVYTAVYTNETKRTSSGELYSFLLASKLFDAGLEVQYHTDSQEEYLFDGFPSRYFTLTTEGIDIGFIKGEYYSRYNGTVAKLGSENDVLARYVS